MLSATCTLNKDDTLDVNFKIVNSDTKKQIFYFDSSCDIKKINNKSVKEIAKSCIDNLNKNIDMNFMIDSDNGNCLSIGYNKKISQFYIDIGYEEELYMSYSFDAIARNIETVIDFIEKYSTMFNDK